MPFALLGHDVWAMRVLGFVLLFGAGAWFGYETSRMFGTIAGEPSRDGLSASIASGAGIWSYYGGFLGPYTPSYNLLTLLYALLVIALALRLGRAILLDERHAPHWTAFALGLFGSAGIANKFSAGIVVLALAFLIVCTLAWRRGDAGIWSRVTLALTAGLALNLVLLWIADPDLPNRFQRGMAVSLALFEESVDRACHTRIGRAPRELIVSLRILLWPVVFAALALAIGALMARRSVGDASAIAILVVGALLDTFVKDNRSHRIVLMTLVVIFLGLAALSGCAQAGW